MGNLKWVIVALVVGGGLYFGYDYWQRQDREAQRAFCARMEECVKYESFVSEFSSLEICERSESVSRRMRTFAECDPDLECSEWLACGATEGGFIPQRDPNRKTNFDEIESALEE
jgi:hypothetical protein